MLGMIVAVPFVSTTRLRITLVLTSSQTLRDYLNGESGQATKRAKGATTFVGLRSVPASAISFTLICVSPRLV